MFHNIKTKATSFLHQAKDFGRKAYALGGQISHGFLQAHDTIKKITPHVQKGLEKVNQINNEIVKSDSLKRGYDYSTNAVNKIKQGSDAVDKAKGILMG